ncbi:MAG: hypothetical protein HY916_07210 [Desulfovibrio sp.]|jgi:hypothetical protein|nr:hypothetical protein [Desulfovibrio sp.]
MRHIAATSLMTLCLAAPLTVLPAVFPAPALAAKGEEAPVVSPADAASDAELREYIRLFGYRDMLEVGVERQLASLLELTRLTRPGLAPGVLELIGQELRAELKGATDEAVAEMAAVFKRRLTRADVAYLNGVGRDPRMQKVIRLQPVIATDLEEVSERLAERVTTKAAPRIEERLKKLQGGQEG